jgi:flagellar L-ring protein precursor FlgH
MRLLPTIGLALVSLFLSLFTGCAGLGIQPTPQPTLPTICEPKFPPPESGSLFTPDRPARLLADLRARDVGDIITVRVDETSKASRSAATSAQRSSTIQAGLDNFFGLAEQLAAKNAHLNTSALIKGSAGNKFAGDGSTSRESTMTANISMRVVEVLPNGNLVIAGSRRIKVNAEDQVIMLSGVVRPADISPDNIVNSSAVADARIEYYGRGVLADKQQPGWLTRIVDWVWPF